MEKNSSREKGNSAEEAVTEMLKKTGYEIIGRNYHSRFGEIDIIAKDGEILVFIEVKYRKNTKYGTPAEAVTLKKQRRIVKTALEYLYKNALEDIPVRFDVAEAYGSGDIKIIEDAFKVNAPAEDFY